MLLDSLPDHDTAPQATDGPFGPQAEASPLVFLFEGDAPAHELRWVTTVAGQASAEGSENTVTLLQDEGGSVGQIVISNQGGAQVLTSPQNILPFTLPNTPPPPPVALTPFQIQQQFGGAISNQPPAPPPTAPLQPGQGQGQAQGQASPTGPDSGPASPLSLVVPDSGVPGGGPVAPPPQPVQVQPPQGVQPTQIIQTVQIGGGGSTLVVGGLSPVSTGTGSTTAPVISPLFGMGNYSNNLYGGGLFGGTGGITVTAGTGGGALMQSVVGQVVMGAGTSTISTGGGGGVYGGMFSTATGPQQATLGLELYSVQGNTSDLTPAGLLLLQSILNSANQLSGLTSTPPQILEVLGHLGTTFQPTQTPSWAAGNQEQPVTEIPTSLDLSAETQSQFVDLDPTGGASPRNTAYYESNSNHHLVEHGTDDPALVKHVNAAITTVTGTALGDEFHGRAGAETFNGEGGSDSFHGSLGNDTMHGGAGTDTLDYSGLTNDNPVSITGTSDGAGTVDVTAPTHFTQTFTGIEVISGSKGSDTITLSTWTSAVTVHGDADDDVITGGAGNDSLHGNEGDDTLCGGGGADYLFGEDGDDILKGSDGGPDSLQGGAGTNAADYSGLSAGVTATFNGLNASVTKAGGTDTLTDISTFTGTNSADTITGSPSTTIFGGGGNDTITSGGVVCGGAGADSIDGANTLIMYRAASEGGDTVTNLGAAKFGFLTGAFGGLTATTQILDGVNFFDAGTSHAGVNQACWYVDGTSLMYDSDGTTGGQAAATIATGADIAGLDAAHMVIVDDAGHQV